MGFNKEQVSKQIQNILRKTNCLQMQSISMPILADEPSTPAERMIFTMALIPAIMAVAKSKGK